MVDRGFARLSSGYASALGRALNYPWLVIGAGVAVLGVAAWTATTLKQEFVPSQDQSRLAVRVTTTVGADLQETDHLVKRLEDFLSKRPEVAGTMSTVNAGSANLSITMVEPKARKLSQSDFSAVLRKEFAGYPGMRASVQDLSQNLFSGGSGYPIEFSVRGPDWPTLVGFASKLREEITQSGLAVDVQSDYQIGAPELTIAPDRLRASDVGVSVQDIATTVSSLVGGAIVGQYSTGGRRLDMRLRLLAGQRTRPEDLQKLYLRTTGGSTPSTNLGSGSSASSAAATQTLVPLSSVVVINEDPELQSINHADRQRAIRVYGNVAPGHSQSEALAFVQAMVKEAPAGYSVVLSGNSSQFGDAMSSLLFALLVGILVAYMVLASQFNSFLHPVTVLTILPLSVAGAIFALFIAGKTLNVFSMIGLLLLMGIVKKNSIILVDYANEVRAEGHDAIESMKRAGPVRLRPILMTAVATLMAAVPSALGLGPGSETRGPMADAVIGGLILSTALSLFVVPSFYVVADRMKSRLARRSAPAAASTVPSEGT